MACMNFKNSPSKIRSDFRQKSQAFAKLSSRPQGVELSASPAGLIELLRFDNRVSTLGPSALAPSPLLGRERASERAVLSSGRPPGLTSDPRLFGHPRRRRCWRSARPSDFGGTCGHLAGGRLTGKGAGLSSALP